jgi:hypothetical protein
MRKIPREIVDTLVQEAASDGRLIEAGWVALRHLVIPEDASDVQVSEMKMAYMSGAQHLWASIFSIMDPDAEPTDEDLRRMELIHKELEKFREEMELRFDRTEGSA